MESDCASSISFDDEFTEDAVKLSCLASLVRDECSKSRYSYSGQNHSYSDNTNCTLENNDGSKLSCFSDRIMKLPFNDSISKDNKQVSSSSSSDFMDKLSLIDVDQQNLNFTITDEDEVDRKYVSENFSSNYHVQTFGDNYMTPSKIPRWNWSLDLDENGSTSTLYNSQDWGCFGNVSDEERKYDENQRIQLSASMTSLPRLNLKNIVPSPRKKSKKLVKKSNSSMKDLRNVENAPVKQIHHKLERRGSLSMSSLPVINYKSDYSHVKSKVKQYIRNIKSIPKVSFTSSDFIPQSHSPSSYHMLDENSFKDFDGELPPEIKALVSIVFMFNIMHN